MASIDELRRAYAGTPSQAAGGQLPQRGQEPVIRAYRQATPLAGPNMTRQATPLAGPNMTRQATPLTGPNMTRQATPLAGQNMTRQATPLAGQNQAMGNAGVGIPENRSSRPELTAAVPEAPAPQRNPYVPVQEAAPSPSPAATPAPPSLSASPTSPPAGGSLLPEGEARSEGEASGGSIPATTPVTYVENGEARQGVADTQGMPSYYEAMKQYYQQMYDEQTGANNAAAAAAAEQARAATQAQIDALNAGYQGTNRELYRDYMERERLLPQQLAAQGYTGGLTESSRLRMGNAYQEALAENERARLSEESGANASLAQQLFESQMATDQANQQARQQQLQYLAALEERQYQDQQSRADLLAASGDFSGYLELGYSQDEVDYLTRLWLKQNPSLLNTWVAAHPEDAARLGIKAKGKSKKKGGGTTVETGKQDSVLTTALTLDAANGSGNAYVNALKKAGAITGSEANRMKQVLHNSTTVLD